ncbi:MAG: ferritin-like domain-containing protein [Candidatus Heimdallarchaeota archaeon]
MDDKEFIEFIEKQIALEKEIVEISNKSVEDVKNILVKELIRGIAMDSKKHELLLTALSGMIKGPTPLIEEENYDKIKATIEKHIELEAKAIDTYKEILTTYEKEDRIRFVVSEIHKDEVRHHTFLKRLLKALIEKETLTEDLLEDWMFKYAPFHGSPGG